MTAWKKHIFQPKSLSEIITTATVVLDTNVLLAAYQWREVAVNEILDSLEKLVNENRLKTPSHVIKEFSKNRPGLIRDMINQIDQVISTLHTPKDLSQVVPALFSTPEFESASLQRDKFLEETKSYRKELKKLIERLEALFRNDPVLERYGQIFESTYYRPDDLEDDEKLKNAFNERIKKGLPPGYKDGKKTENAEGDYILWAHILKISNDVIFVTNDSKPDWSLTHQKKVLAPSRELIEEFYENSSGKSIVFTKPNEFFQLLKPDLSEETKKNLTETEKLVEVLYEDMSLGDPEYLRNMYRERVKEDIKQAGVNYIVDSHIFSYLVQALSKKEQLYYLSLNRLVEMKKFIDDEDRLELELSTLTKYLEKRLEIPEDLI